MVEKGFLSVMLYCLLKFVFSKKATKIDGIFTVDLTFTKGGLFQCDEIF